MANSVFINSQGGQTFDGSTYSLGPLTVTSIGSLGGVIALNFGSSNAAITFGARAAINSPADGQLNITNFAGTAGIGLDVTTDSTVKVRTRAQTGYGTVDTLGLAVSGAAGASKGAGAVTSLTATNGIIAAIS